MQSGNLFAWQSLRYQTLKRLSKMEGAALNGSFPEVKLACDYYSHLQEGGKQLYKLIEHFLTRWWRSPRLSTCKRRGWLKPPHEAPSSTREACRQALGPYQWNGPRSRCPPTWSGRGCCVRRRQMQASSSWHRTPGMEAF